MTAIDLNLKPLESHMSGFPEKTLGEWIEEAVASGISRSHIDRLLAGYPATRRPIWWETSARSDLARQVQHGLEVIERKAWEAKAAQWSKEELEFVVAEHRAGRPADSDKLAEAVHRGLIGMSAAMNQDF